MDINHSQSPLEVRWSGTKGEFIEFVMIVTDYSICTNEKPTPISGPQFLRLCDTLGTELLTFFKVDISPHQSFTIMREQTIIDYRFTKRIIRVMKRLKEDEHFIRLLEERGILPSYEYVTDHVVKWSNAEKIAALLWLHIYKK